MPTVATEFWQDRPTADTSAHITPGVHMPHQYAKYTSLDEHNCFSGCLLLCFITFDHFIVFQLFPPQLVNKLTWIDPTPPSGFLTLTATKLNRSLTSLVCHRYADVRYLTVAGGMMNIYKSITATTHVTYSYFGSHNTLHIHLPCIVIRETSEKSTPS